MSLIRDARGLLRADWPGGDSGGQAPVASTGGPRLLVLACSATKSRAEGLVPALERYDGPAYQVLRAALRDGAAAHVEVLILSAEFGLIPPTWATPFYDRFLDGARARELVASPGTARARVLDAWARARPGAAAARPQWREVLVYGSSRYRLVLQAWGAGGLFDASPILFTSGRPGEQLQQLSQWLRSNES